jgi:hypothetical protein
MLKDLSNSPLTRKILTRAILGWKTRGVNAREGTPAAVTMTWAVGAEMDSRLLWLSAALGGLFAVALLHLGDLGARWEVPSHVVVPAGIMMTLAVYACFRRRTRRRP